MKRAPKNRSILDEAKLVAGEIANRQYLDTNSPIDGVYGMFKEFSQSDSYTADDNAFLLESAQTGMNHLGNYQFTSLQGFIDLLEFAPADADAAKWHRVISQWANRYIKPAASANPLKAVPITVYKSINGSNSGKVYWFGSHLHGGNEVPGQAARSLLQIGNYLKDKTLHNLAIQGAQWYAGVNPGIAIGSGGFKWRA